MTRQDRLYIRKNALHLLNYNIIDQHGLYTICSMGRTLDLSENGLKLETTQQILKGDTLLITVELGEELVDLRGEVKHTNFLDDRYITGIEFQDISPVERNIFKKYIEFFRSRHTEHA